MESRVLKTLEFDKIRALVAAHCTSSAGRSYMEKLVPSQYLRRSVRLLRRNR